MKHRLTGTMESSYVFLDGKFLNPSESQKVRNHSPDGFMWGYGGSGPAQLALAVCLKLCTTKEEAQLKYQDFKWDVIAKLPQTDFDIEFEF